jgi:hypothetical protein
MRTLLDDLVAFFQEHRRCGWLDGGVEGERVWMSRDCGGAIRRHTGAGRLDPIVQRFEE